MLTWRVRLQFILCGVDAALALLTALAGQWTCFVFLALALLLYDVGNKTYAHENHKEEDQ